MTTMLPPTPRRCLAALTAALALTAIGTAQVGTLYQFSQNAGTYTPIAGTQIAAATGLTGVAGLDDNTYTLTLPFAFNFDGLPYTTIQAQTNGHIAFGTTVPGTSYTPLNSTIAVPGFVAAFGRDLMAGWMTSADRVTATNVLTNVVNIGPMQVGDFIGGTGIPANTTITAISGNTITLSANATTTGTAGYIYAAGPWAEMRYDTLGSAPNQIFVVQWSNFRRYTTSGLTTAAEMALNFQIRLHQTSGQIEVVYGNCTPGSTTITTTTQVGLRGPTNAFPADVNNRLNTKGVNDDWINSLPGTANSSGLLFNNVAPANVIATGLTYTWDPPVGAYAGFTADVTSGPSPLVVNFTDQSFTTVPSGIIGWAWDFDGDSVVDSTLQNPSFVYANCGSYTVSLTVTDGVSPTNTLTRTGYINTDNISANFTSQVIGPLTVTFTDTSNMPASSWAWDLDGDTVVDSTLQNPAWVYANANPVNVSLTVTRLCSAPSTITRSIVPLQQISHNVAPNNGLGTGASVYFDLNVTNPSGIRIGSMDVAPSIANTAFTVEVFVRQGTYTGFTGTASEWVSAGVGTSAGGPVTTSASAPVSFTQPLYLPPGLHGIKLWYIGVGPRYQTGTAITTVSNGDLDLTVGTSRGSSTTNAWAGSDITPRLWSGVLYYDTHNVTGNAGFGTFGPGCAGTLGTPSITANANPTLGSTLSLTVNNLPNSNMVMCTGFSNTTSLFGPLPYDVTPLGAPGCFLRASTEAVLFVAGANNQAVWNFAIPNNPAFSGIIYYNQAIAGDLAANAFGATVSNATSMLIGN